MKRLLIANRGEIAVRVIRAAKDLGIETVAIYSEPDEGALHVRLADKKIALRGSHVRDTYLNLETVINAAIQSGADAVHPGYGFFSENPAFEKAIRESGLCYVGPHFEAISLMADKVQARKRVSEFGVPIIPGIEVDANLTGAKQFAAKIGYPVLVKAAAGGGGRGMRVVERETELTENIAQAKREALASFGSDEVFLEKFLTQPRHIEVQVFGDSHGTIVHFGERECSIQRRHQKLVEESPAPNLLPALREKILQAAVNAARSVKYLGAGTVEFLVDDCKSEKGAFYFLEMNTRIQVEHPVTEIVSDVDLVQLQLRVASGDKIEYTSAKEPARQHAIEFRVYAENVRKDFQPTAGVIRYLSRSFGPGVREDSWVEAGTKISSYYDSLLSKLIVSAASREEALARARTVLDEYVIEGLETTLDFHRWLLRQDDFLRGDVDVRWVERTFHGETVRGTGVGPLTLPPLQAR